jgi:protein involved in polysaccharide export with SLBB domain
MKMSNLVRSMDDLLPGAFLDYALIQRTDRLTRSVSTKRVSLQKLLINKEAAEDVELTNEDKVYVFEKSAIIPLDYVSVSGSVVNTGQYPYAESMRLVDLLLAAGGASNNAFLMQAEITRYVVIEGERRVTSHIKVDLAKALTGNDEANVVLQPYDELLVRKLSKWNDSAAMEVLGEVAHPGRYSIGEGERLSDVIERAGGFTPDAYLKAAVFTRESIKQNQQKQIDELARRMESQLGLTATKAENLKDPILKSREVSNVEAARRVLDQLRQTRATGRLVIEVQDMDTFKKAGMDIYVQAGDSLSVPKRPDEVSVIGEVYNQSAFLHTPKYSRSDYLNQAGPTTMANMDEIYVIKANGRVESGKNGMFAKGGKIEPGDVIVVPQDLSHTNILDSILDWGRATMQIATSIAATKAIGLYK